jgi:hypothetical protein
VKALAAYVDELADLLRELDPVRTDAALDGAVAAELRYRVTVKARRAAGAFFTSQQLASQVVGREVSDARAVVDPAMGCGDLLLAAARQFALGRSVSATLEAWGARLYGTDVRPTFVRAARIRLALLAAHRHGSSTSLTEARLEELLPNLRVGNGQTAAVPNGATVVLNPPYGTVEAPRRLTWASGKVSRAAIFTARVLEAAPNGVNLAAILPDVLRSGTRYSRWRACIDSLLDIDEVSTVGQFDPWTDVDVFVLRGTVDRIESPTAHVSWVREWTGEVVEEYFKVRVGAVVPHRDKKRGPRVPYITARDLPLGGSYETADAPTRRFGGATFEPPFVLVRRTSRPTPHARAIATVVRGPEPVAVENHLLVCLPLDGTLRACRDLQAVLHAGVTSDWLDERIRCRHLTATALLEVPWRGRYKRAPAMTGS